METNNNGVALTDGLELTRIAGTKHVKIVGRRKNLGDETVTIYEIAVDKVRNVADVTKDSETLFTVVGGTINHSRVEKIATAGLRKYVRSVIKGSSSYRRRKRAEAAEATAAETTAAETEVGHE